MLLALLLELEVAETEEERIKFLQRLMGEWRGKGKLKRKNRK